MTHAYQEMYLSNAQALLGDAFDYAINACSISGNDFVKLFSVSSVSKRIENGEPTYLAGKSGIEVVADVLVETAGKTPTAKPQVTFSRSREYWIGWAIAYYQWFSGRKFSNIFKVLSFEDLLQMYAPLHEADISKFADIADEEGFPAIAKMYREIAVAEKGHEERYLALAKNIEDDKVFKKDVEVVWQCRNCGYLFVGKEAPETCPACLHPQAYFEVKKTNF